MCSMWACGASNGNAFTPGCTKQKFCASRSMRVKLTDLGLTVRSSLENVALYALPMRDGLGAGYDHCLESTA